MDGFFHLAWGNHNSIIVQNFQRLQEKESFCDVTIVCDRKHFPLHKLVLSSCSKYFEEIFEETPCRHPFIVLKDFEAETFENLIEFMYKGEVNISQDRLPVFISAANSLKVKGISIPEESSLKKKRELVCSSLQPSKKSKNSKQKSIETSSDPETNKENGETAGTSESCLKDVEEAIESAQESCLLNVSKTSDSVECGESFGEMKHFMGEPVNFFLGSLKGTRVKQELDLMALADCNSYPSTSQEILSSSQNEDDQGFEFDASNFPEVAINQSTPSGPMQERGRDQLADMLEKIFGKVVKVQKRIDVMDNEYKTLLNILTKSTGIDPYLEDSLKNMPVLPITCIEEFQHLEHYLSDEQNFNAFVHLLKNCGGGTPEAFSKNAMGRILTNRAGAIFNLEGRSSHLSKDQVRKIAFLRTKCYSSVLDALKLNSATKNADPLVAKKTIKNWLQMAPFRKGGGGRT